MAQLYSLNTGYFGLDGGAMFGVVPRVLWQREHQPDEQNRIHLAMRVLLIKDGDRTILVDTGLGDWHNEKFVRTYAVQNNGFDFDTALAPFDTSSDCITDLVISHLHFDHAAGLIRNGPTGPIAAFTRARIWMQQKHWLWARLPCARDRASFLRPYIDMLDAYDCLELVDGDEQISDSVSIAVVNGHTPGMQIVNIRSDAGTALFVSDLVPTASHLRIPYIMAYDNEPIMATAEKENILTQACQHQWTLFFPHDPIHASGRITKQNDQFCLKPATEPSGNSL